MAFPTNDECFALSEEDLRTVSDRAGEILKESERLKDARRYRRAVQKALRAADLYEVVGNRFGRSRSLTLAGLFCIKAKHFRAAAYYMWKGLRVLEKQDYEKRAYFWGALARIYRNLWSMDRAEKYYRIYLSLSMKEDNMIQVGYANVGLGLNYFQQGDYPKALKLTERALGIFESLDQNALIFLASGNLACVYNKMGLHEESLRLLTGILADKRLPDNALYLCHTYHELARTYLCLKDFDRYPMARDKAWEYATLSKDMVELGRMTMLDAEWHASQGQQRKAMQSLRKAIVVFRNHGSPTDLIPAERLMMKWLKGGEHA
ncbi:MAG TPA: tetratricopeptide repeat protein [Bacillota bacterium]